MEAERIRYSLEDVDAMDAEQLRDLKDEVEIAIARIKTQLDGAYQEYQEDGTNSDPDWFHRARSAQRYHALIMNRVNRRLGDVRRQEKEKARERFQQRQEAAEARRNTTTGRRIARLEQVNRILQGLLTDDQMREFESILQQEGE